MFSVFVVGFSFCGNYVYVCICILKINYKYILKIHRNIYTIFVMWFENQVSFPRFVKSVLWTLLMQHVYMSILLFTLKIVAWNPFAEIFDWFLCVFHWKTIIYQFIFCLTTIAFGVLNQQFSSVEKHVSSTRFEKICYALSPHQLQHFLVTGLLGGIISFCIIGLFGAFNLQNSFIARLITLKNDFEIFFVIQHGCYTGIMFSLKYFICYLYVLKFSLDQVSKVDCVIKQLKDLFKDSIYCILTSLHWYYLLFIFFGPILENILSLVGVKVVSSTSMFDLLFKLLNLKLLAVTFLIGVIIFFNWSLYLCIFNACFIEHHLFPIEMPVQSEKEKSLISALKNSNSDVLHYLAVLDLRLLSEKDVQRRKKAFAISHPGGHPYHWNAISEICVTSLKSFLLKLQEYAASVASKDQKIEINKSQMSFIDKEKTLVSDSNENYVKQPKTVESYFRCWPIVSYFLDELPTTKIKQIFKSSQPLIWMIDSLGYLVSASYTEDNYGVIQKTLPEIICLLLDIKMAEEKLPLGVVGIRTQVKDPQGRYDHLHFRVALKHSVNATLCRIADTFKKDINGIYLQEEYNRYFQRYLNRKK